MNKRQRKKFEKRQNEIIDEAIYIAHGLIDYLNKNTKVDVDSLMFQLATTTESSKVISKKIPIDIPPSYIKAAKIIARIGYFCNNEVFNRFHPDSRFLRPSTNDILEEWDRPHECCAWCSNGLYQKDVKMKTVGEYERYVGKKFVEQF